MAFDYDGWTLEAELIEETVKFEAVTTPDLRLKRTVIDCDLTALCTRYQHRAPADFVADPRPRARRYSNAILRSAVIESDPRSLPH